MRAPDLSGLSFAQERLWFLERLNPGTAVYNVPLVFDLAGRVEEAALKGAYESLVARHAAFQPLFGASESLAPWRSTLAGDEAEATQLVEQFVREPFDLAQQPPIRALHVRLDERRSMLALCAHHIAVDGQTLEIMQRELFELYAAQVEGRAPALDPLEAHYPDFARWQREWLSGERLESRLAYWRSRLEGVDDSSPLMPDFPRPQRARNRGAIEIIELPSELQEAVRRAGEGAGASPYVVLLAAFFVLLYRYSGRQDLCVGTLLANRNRLPRQWRRLVSGMAGFFVNALALRQEVMPDQSFRQVLEATQATVMGAFAHQDLPFGNLVEAIGAPRDLSKNPIFQVTFALQEVSPRSFDAGVKVRRRDVHTGASRGDLMLTIGVAGPDARAIAEYDTDLFRASTIRRLLRHYRRLTEVLVANADAPIARAEFLAPEERRALAVDFNPPPTADPSACIHQLFEEQARRQPDAPAIWCGDRRWSYGELNAQANRVAWRLLAKGIEREDRVGVCGARDAHFAATLLGVLKAGAAYLPMDPEYPDDRLRYMADDAGLRSILADADQREHVEGLGVPVIDLAVEGGDDSNPDVDVEPSNLCYLLYTSGSTGKPKGVAIEHRNVAALADWARGAFSAEDLARVLCATSFCFDVSAFELFAPLLAGGSVELVDSLLDLAEPSSRLRPTLVSGGPSALDKLLRAGAIPDSVRVVVSAGERLSQALADRMYAAHPNTRVLDCYGPTEDTVYATCCVRSPGGIETIGTSLPHGRSYVLDANQQLAPIGAPGELYLGGRRLARGYWGRPELTQEHFLPDPFLPGERVYRTGDRARRLEDGSIQFLGRLDRQLKIRGYRIEPGEIETALLKLPGVEEACALVRDAPEGAILIAYVVLSEGRPPDAARRATEIRRLLALELPPHAVPNRIALLAALPRLPGGKIDQAALDESPDCAAAPDIHEPPSGETERMVAGAFAQTLRLSSVGRDDSFFDIGGHSLMAFDLLFELERRSGLQIPFAVLFQGPTPRAFAAYLDERSHGGAKPQTTMRSLVAIRATGEKPPLLIVPGIGGNVIGLAPLSRRLGPAQPVYGLQSRGLDGTIAPRETIEEIAADYLAEAAALTARPCVLLGICWGAAVALEMARRLSAEGSPPALLALLDPSPIGGVEETTPAANGQSKLESSLRAVRAANHEAAHRYRPTAYQGRAVIFATQSIGENDPRLAWADLITPAPRILPVPGRSSDETLSPPHVEQFAASLAEQVQLFAAP